MKVTPWSATNGGRERFQTAPRIAARTQRRRVAHTRFDAPTPVVAEVATVDQCCIFTPAHPSIGSRPEEEVFAAVQSLVWINGFDHLPQSRITCNAIYENQSCTVYATVHTITDQSIINQSIINTSRSINHRTNHTSIHHVFLLHQTLHIPLFTHDVGNECGYMYLEK